MRVVLWSLAVVLAITVVAGLTLGIYDAIDCEGWGIATDAVQDLFYDTRQCPYWKS